MEALGTCEADFLNGIIRQLTNVGSQGTTADEHGLNFMLAMVKGIEPKDQAEAMLAAQMAAVHNATMTFARRLNHVDNIPQQDSAGACLQQARPNLRGSSRSPEAIPDRRAAEGHGRARHRERRRPSHRRKCRDPGGALPKNQRINPMRLPMHQAPRCKARSKRTGKPCQSPAVRGHSVCRMHGARGGAPIANRNARKHGGYSCESLALRRHIAELARTARRLRGEASSRVALLFLSWPPHLAVTEFERLWGALPDRLAPRCCGRRTRRILLPGARAVMTEPRRRLLEPFSSRASEPVLSYRPPVGFAGHLPQPEPAQSLSRTRRASG